MKYASSRGFSLVEVMVTAGILGIVALAFTNFMGSIRVAFNSQVDLEVRVELFQTLNSMQRMVDCKATLGSVPAGTTIPATGLPIALIGSAAGGSTYISEFGGKKGRFSLLADIFPDTSIKIRAAAFKTEGELPRSRLSASDSEFLSKKSSSGVWSWEYTNKLIEKNFPVLASICGGNVAAAGAGSSGDVSLQCSASLSTGTGGPTYPTAFCMAVNTKTKLYCGPIQLNQPMDPGGVKERRGINNCMLFVQGCPDGQTLQNPASSCVGMYCAKTAYAYDFTCGPKPDGFVEPNYY